MTARPILTAAEMRSAEERAVASGTAVETLMERAGLAAAEAIRRYSGPLPALVLCGPGNNGGDGYVVARALRERGVRVAVAALGEPVTPAARAARGRWGGAVLPLAEAGPAPLLIDALFGTGLRRPLDCGTAAQLGALAAAASVKAALDLPSGCATDDGALLSQVPDFDLTVAFGTLKPSHLLQPAARHMGRIVVADIGIEAESALREIARPGLRPPGPDDHKYKRGFVLMMAGEMPGAAALAAAAALRSGAGYVRLLAPIPLAGVPTAVVQGSDWALDDERIGAVLAGPGLGRSDAAAARLDRVLASGRPLVLDGDALTLIAESGLEILHEAAGPSILTPHEGEFRRLFGSLSGNKVERARRAAESARSVVVYKGPDTVVAAPDGRAAIAAAGSHCLATAGTGDVLAGAVAALRGAGLDPFEAACAGVWLHNRAAEIAGPGLIADDLLAALARSRAECA